MKKSNKKIIKRLIIFGVAILCAVSAVALPTMSDSAPATAMIRVPADATPEILRDTLTKYFGESYTSNVMHLVRLSGRDLKTRHGAYLIKEGTSALKAQRTITHGAQTPIKVTVNGFRDFDNLCSRVANKFDFTAAQLKQAATASSTLSRYGLSRPEEAPVLWVDDTYEFYWTDTPERVVEKVASNFTGFWNEERTAKAKALGLTPAEISIIASITDEETNLAEEKGKVGRLYINRLQRGMKLQADPTVRFAANDFSIKRVTSKHLSIDSPYNTYRVKGLPPGPIRTTSKATMQAILDSQPSDYLYMCAKEDFSGGHNFAADYAAHMANARRYQAALDSLGIK